MKFWQRSFEHFARGKLTGCLPLGSWVLLQGSETTSILRDSAHHENLNLGVLDVNTMQVIDEGGFATSVICVSVADTKAQVALSGCRNIFFKKDTFDCGYPWWQPSPFMAARILHYVLCGGKVVCNSS